MHQGVEIARVEVPGWPTTPSCSPSATPCWSNSANWVWAIRWPSPRPTSRPSSPDHDREEFRRLTLMLLEQRGLPTPESAKAFSKRRPWV